MNGKKVVVGCLFALIIFGLIFIGVFSIFDKKLTNTKTVPEAENIIAKQSKLDLNIKSEGYTFNNPNVILNPYEISPLTAVIAYDSENETNVTVTIVGKDEKTTIKHTFAPSKKHLLPIYGLYPNYNNTIILESNGLTKEINIQTSALPENFIIPSNIYANKELLDNDLYFYTPSSVGYTSAYDINGDVRWYLTTHALWKIDRLQNGHLLISTDRPINTPYYMTGLYEMDLLGKIYNEYSLEGGYHHDYYELPSGNILVASDEFENEAGTVEDVIYEINRKNGKVVKTFDLKKILKMEDGKSENWINYDWFHNNAIWYDSKTNSITLSGRHQDAVINIDYETGKLNWIIGDSTNWSEEYKKYFFTPIGDDFEWQWSQHAAMVTPEGYIFIFDNGNNKSKNPNEYVPATESYSRGVMYEINTTDMTIKQVWQYGKERGSDYYSPYISDVDYLAENHYIVHSGGISYVNGVISNKPAGFGSNVLKSITTELLNNEVIFELALPSNYYRVEKMSLYTENEELVLGKANELGTLGETKVESKVSGFINNIKNIDDDYKSHNIKLTKEKDRLVVSGQFKKGTSVKIYLYRNMKSIVYDMKIAKKPYTALCVDVFTETETENGINVTKYINDVNLKGEYSIYLQIDGTMYNTEYNVNFGWY